MYIITIRKNAKNIMSKYISSKCRMQWMQRSNFDYCHYYYQFYYKSN